MQIQDWWNGSIRPASARPKFNRNPVENSCYSLADTVMTVNKINDSNLLVAEVICLSNNAIETTKVVSNCQSIAKLGASKINS